MPDKSSSQSTGISLVITFLVIWLVNSLVIWLANLLFPQLVVLGTVHIPKLWVFFHATGTLALINTFAVPFVRLYENKQSQMLDSKSWMILYFIINFVSLWVIARFAEQLGLGLRSWLVALGLALILDIFQGLAMMQVEKTRAK